MTAREIIEAEDPKQIIIGGQLGRYKALVASHTALLKSFCDNVQEALEHLDAGNAENWPPPPGMTPEQMDNEGYSRWGYLWRELEEVRKTFGA